MRFLLANGVVVGGVCVDIIVMGTPLGLARLRGYEIQDTQHDVCELIISHAEFPHPEFRNYRIAKLLRLIVICYGIMLDLNPQEIIYPGGLYGVRPEQRAMRDYMRPKTDHEIKRGSELTRHLSTSAKSNSPLYGTYCFDDSKMSILRRDIDQVLTDSHSGRDFGTKVAVQDIITPKVRALLECAREMSKLPSIFNQRDICPKCGMNMRPFRSCEP